MTKFHLSPANLNVDFAKLDSVLNELNPDELLSLSQKIQQKLHGAPVPADEFLTVKQVCAYLKLCRTSVWRYSKMGILKPHKIGGRILYARSSIDLFLRKEVSNG